MFSDSQSVHVFLSVSQVKIYDLMYEKWILMHEIFSDILFFNLLQWLEFIELVEFLIFHYVSGHWVRFALLVSIKIN